MRSTSSASRGLPHATARTAPARASASSSFSSVASSTSARVVTARDEPHRAAAAHVDGSVHGAAPHGLGLTSANRAQEKLGVGAVERDQRTSQRFLRDAARVGLRWLVDETRPRPEQLRHEVVGQRVLGEARGFRDDAGVPSPERLREQLAPLGGGGRQCVERRELFVD